MASGKEQTISGDNTGDYLKFREKEHDENC